MLDEHTIRDFNQKPFTKEEFLKQLKAYDEDGFNVFIGTDSQIIKKKISIVTAVCFHKSGEEVGSSSGKIFYMKEKISRKQYPNLRTRMLLEAYRSIELAMELEPLVSTKLEVHLDVGDTIRSKTSKYERELQALVLSQGYSCEIKPYSWASSAVADRVVR
jgi:predicted RNase H-related nuclease YkuK (DUF458 family)